MKFGQYELLEQIAVGGMAEVFKGRVVAAEGFEKLVAIKRILPDLAEDERFVKMLLTEARIHSALSHRNIVQIHDLGISEQGEYFIVLEFVEGYDLRVITDQLHAAGEIIPEALSLHIAGEIAQALSFAHELRGADGKPLGLVHRDVTPSNILISFAGEVKLSDFGLAKRRSDHSVVGSLKGNLAYMSPEQAMQAGLDKRSDIFSLGAILFEMLTGRRLREITDEVAGWNQVASGVLPSARSLRPDLPPAVESLLNRALAPDPAARFPDAATFGAAIRSVLGDLSVAVGASDLASLLSVIKPPRRARTLMLERSKVIRLGPEAEALKEAILAPATPAPLTPPLTSMPQRPAPVRLRDPGPTPPATRAPGPGRRSEPRAAVRAAPDPNATPPPNQPLPPARTRGYTPHRPSSDAQDVKTPIATPLPTPVIPQTSIGRAGLNRVEPGARPAPGASQSTMRGPAPSARGSSQPIPVQAPARSPSQPIPTQVPARNPSQPFAMQAQPRSGSQPNPVTVGRRTPAVPARTDDPVQPGTPAYGVQRPSQRAFALAETMTAPGGMPAGGRDHPPFPNRRVHHETARVQYRPPRQWGGVFMVIVLLLAAGAVGVHVLWTPLDVLITWGQPTGLSIATDPSGAKLRLDGVPLVSTAPITVSVTRDRADHVLEATYPGYQVARETIRYDKSATLSYVLRLQRDPNAPPPAAAPAAPDPVPPRPGNR